MLPDLNDDEHAVFEELVLTGLPFLEKEPVIFLMRAFAWLEQRRLKKEWKLFELGLLLVRGQLRGRNKRHPLVKDILRYLKQRKCRYLEGIDRPTRIPRFDWEKGMTKAERARWRILAKRKRRKWDRDERLKSNLLRRSFARGEAMKLFPVIAFRKKGGGVFVTVWGIKSPSGQWPTPREVQRQRRVVWRANQPETTPKKTRRPTLRAGRSSRRPAKA